MAPTRNKEGSETASVAALEDTESSGTAPAVITGASGDTESSEMALMAITEASGDTESSEIAPADVTETSDDTKSSEVNAAAAASGETGVCSPNTQNGGSHYRENGRQKICLQEGWHCSQPV